MTLPAGLTRAIAGFVTPIATNMMERQEVVIKLREKFNLKHENLPDNFPVVYAYTLVEYGVGKEQVLLNLFEQPEIQEAFRCEFRENNPARLEEAVEESVNWELLDWNALGQHIKDLAADAQQDTKEYIQQEIEDFRKVFYQKVLPLTLKPSQVHQDRRIQDILDKLDRLDTLEDIRTAVQQILELLKDVSNYQNQSNATKSVALNSKLREILKLYLGQCYRDERVAKLDQAGERDSEQETYLNKVFIDLDVSLREGIEKRKAIYRKFRNRINKIQQVNEEIAEGISEEDFFYDDSRTLSVMECLLQELHPKIVIIGGPGQGKSTSGQQLAQIHRAKLINEDYDDRYQPKTVRIPFQIVLKDFAQWLADEPEIDALDAYLAEKVGKLAKCPGDIRPQDIQEIFSKRDCLLLLDGLDEVVEPKLKKQMLKKIQDFLAERESSTKSNVTVVATSRPNGYDNQFDPEQFIHLELEFLNQEKVTEYAQKWVEAKRLTDEESSKTLNTLKDCQRDNHIQGLLTTPLQVTIILIIIKSGRRPPSQREDLFNEYWLTIFRREESKDSGKAIVKSKESFLLNLHSVLGYSIHRRAIKKNIKSLLSENEFKDLVTNFLHRKKGNCTTAKEITQERDRLVRDVGERLVLIVQKEADFYGFDLRSFQEFFAAIYLVQAKNTKQRFDRLTAIAPYEHWRNVALFAAGRIARNFSGEVTQLTEVWRSIDRTGVNRYLKPGAWLALQIAADGALSDEANLQYSAVDDGLKVLEMGLTSEQNAQLRTLIGRLTEEEKQKILRPVLEEKLRLLPESCLIPGLSIYGEYFGANDFFINKLDAILEEQKKEALINSVLNLAIKYKSKPSWIAKKLKKHFFEAELENICLENFKYFKDILNQEEFLDDSRLVNLHTKISLRSRYYQYHPRITNEYLSLLIAEISDKKAYSTSEQLIICILLKYLIDQLPNSKKPYRRSFRERMKEIDITVDDKKYGEIDIYNPRLDFLDKLGSRKENLQNQIEYLLQYQELFPTVKLLSQHLLLRLNPNKEEYIYDLLNCLCHVQINNLIDQRTLLDYFSYNQPLLLFASKLRINQEQKTLDKLLPFLKHDKQVEIAEQIENIIRDCIKSLEKEKIANFLKSIRYKIRIDEFLSDLIPIANQMGIELEKLISSFVFSARYQGDDQYMALDKKLLSEIMPYNKDENFEFNDYKKILYILTSSDFTWSLEEDDIERIVDFFDVLMSDPKFINEQDGEKDNNQFVNSLIFGLGLKLIEYTKSDSCLLKAVSSMSINNYPISSIAFMFRIGHLLNKENIKLLKAFLEEEDRDLFLKGAVIWQAILDAEASHSGISENLTELLSEISLSTSMGKRIFQEYDSSYYSIGITLLTYSGYSIENIEEQHQLLNWLINANSKVEERGWSEFIKKVAISDDEQLIWSSFLEQILSEPKQFGHLILSAAMERYQSLNNAAQITIAEEQERKLDLLQ